MLDQIERMIELEGPLDVGQKAQILEIAGKMPGPPHPDLGDQDPLAAGLRLTDAVAWCMVRDAIASATWRFRSPAA